MRLYKLISRHGQFKKRMYPWFDPPPVGAPKKYDGWTWNPAEREWVEDDVARIEFEVRAPKYPRPTEPPRPAQPLYVPGWYWNGRAGVWEEQTMPFEEVLVIPERPPMPTEWPSRTQPAEVLGWRYSFMYEVWEKIPMEGHTEMVEKERGPKPEYPPGAVVPHDVEGWSWSDTTKEWVATIIFAERVGFTPPRSLPPGVTQEAVFDVFSVEHLYAEEVNYFINQGYTVKAAIRITRENFDPLLRMLWAQKHAASSEGWMNMIAGKAGMGLDEFKDLSVMGIVYLLTALAGLLIGDILRRLAFVDIDDYFLVAPPNTYLLGPENWAYSKHIGTSVRGGQYFSSCEDIGTEYVRHKRGRWSGEYDIIDFLGGFLETGFQFPYWVKYRWGYWRLQYIGMLMSRGERFYELKKSDYNRYAVGKAPWMMKHSEWCADFHYYL